MAVSNWLKGTLDYYFQASNLLVIEAKRDNLDNGFTQLAAELIALDQWTDQDVALLYGNSETSTRSSSKTLIDRGEWLPRLVHWPSGYAGLAGLRGVLSSPDLRQAASDSPGFNQQACPSGLL